MNIVIITLEKTKAASAADTVADSVMGDGANEVARYRRKRFLPIQLLAIAGDLLDAGHAVHWPDESLNSSNIDRIVAEAQLFCPDILFFAGGDEQTCHLMAGVAIKVGGVPVDLFVSAGEFNSAFYWRDILTTEQVSLDLLLEIVGGADVQSSARK